MKRIFALLLAVCLLAGCTQKQEAIPETPTTTVEETTPQETIPVQTQPLQQEVSVEIPVESRFDSVTEIVLSDDGITVDGADQTDSVYTSHDIIYYEDKDAYESGNPYGEGEAWEKHTEAEAAAHTVVNITTPGAYRVSGKLSQGQIRIDLGEDAYDDPNAVVELILSNADITCTVAPAILFLNVYECDGQWSTDTATSNVDTAAAGANLVLEDSNIVSGSHVAKVYKDKEGEKKLWKQDGAVYSYMSMNVFGPGKLDLYADNEGLDTELHLTINGGNVAIRSDNDGINTNEDGVSVTTINGGNLHIIAGLGAEGDGIDSNGWLVINGGTVVSAANPGADAGLDSDLGSYVNGGTVIALGSTMDWAESESKQVTMNLQFAANQSSDAAVVVTRQDGTVIFAYDPGSDEVLAENSRVYSGAVISCANFHVGETYHVYVDGEVTGEDKGGIYDVTTVTGYTGGIQMAYTGTDVMRRPGGMGFGGNTPENFDPNNLPEGMEGFRPGQKPDGMDEDMMQGFDPNQMPEGMEGFDPNQMPQGMAGFDPNQMPQGMADFDPNQMPQGMADFDPNQMPQSMEDFDPSQMPAGMENFQPGQNPSMAFPGGMTSGGEAGEPSTEFYMQDHVNFFSGLTQQ